MLALDLLLGLGLSQRDDLCLGQHQALLGTLGFQRLEPLVHRSRSWRSHTQRTPAGETTSPRFLNSLATRLTKRWLLERELSNSLLDLFGHPISQNRLLAVDLLQRKLPAVAVELLEAVKAVAAIAVCTKNSDSHVAVMQSAKERMRRDATDSLNRARQWRIFVKRSARSQIVVIAGVRLQNPTQVRLAQGDHMVDALSSDRSRSVFRQSRCQVAERSSPLTLGDSVTYTGSL